MRQWAFVCKTQCSSTGEVKTSATKWSAVLFPWAVDPGRPEWDLKLKIGSEHFVKDLVIAEANTKQHSYGYLENLWQFQGKNPSI